MNRIDDQLDRASTAVRVQVDRISVRPPAMVARRQRRLRSATFALGLTALMMVVAVPAVLLNDAAVSTNPAEVPAETAPVSTDPAEIPAETGPPPVVQGETGPTPVFDTNDLGTSQPLNALSDLTRVNSIAERFVNAIAENEDAKILQITVLGETPNGAATLIVHAQLESSSGLIQMRCFVTEEGGGCAGDQANAAAENPDGLLPPGLLFQGLAYGVVGGDGVLAWEVPENTSVAVLTINGTSRWQTPVSRVAVFDSDLRDGDNIKLTALNRDGDILDTYSETAQNKSDPNGIPMTQPDD
jgi:hypothetical protein